MFKSKKEEKPLDGDKDGDLMELGAIDASHPPTSNTVSQPGQSSKHGEKFNFFNFGNNAIVPNIEETQS